MTITLTSIGSLKQYPDQSFYLSCSYLNFHWTKLRQTMTDYTRTDYSPRSTYHSKTIESALMLEHYEGSLVNLCSKHIILIIGFFLCCCYCCLVFWEFSVYTYNENEYFRSQFVINIRICAAQFSSAFFQ